MKVASGKDSMRAETRLYVAPIGALNILDGFLRQC